MSTIAKQQKRKQYCWRNNSYFWTLKCCAQCQRTTRSFLQKQILWNVAYGKRGGGELPDVTRCLQNTWTLSQPTYCINQVAGPYVWMIKKNSSVVMILYDVSTPSALPHLLTFHFCLLLLSHLLHNACGAMTWLGLSLQWGFMAQPSAAIIWRDATAGPYSTALLRSAFPTHPSPVSSWLFLSCSTSCSVLPPPTTCSSCLFLPLHIPNPALHVPPQWWLNGLPPRQTPTCTEKQVRWLDHVRKSHSESTFTH